MPKIIFLLLCALCNFKLCANMTIAEFIFGPKLGSGNTSRRIGRELQMQVGARIIEEYGYPAETHEVTTDDGYILVLHRIASSRKKKATGQKSPVIIQHGLFASSDCWLFRGPTKDLTYILSDAGFDVWVANSRGNYYSRRHKVLDPDKDTAFWNFTANEMGLYDVPATIDYVLNATRQRKVYFIGHSIGATAAIILCSMKPEYNEKIKLLINLAPLAYTKHRLEPLLGLTFTTTPLLTRYLTQQNIYEIFPRRENLIDIFNILCLGNPLVKEICGTLTSFITGGDYTVFFASWTFPMALHYYPGGTSVKLMEHISQLFLTGTLKPYDEYDLDLVPEYNVTKITAPVSLHFADGDILVSSQDVEALASKLPNVVAIDRIADKSYSHIDFLWPSNRKKIANYYRIIDLMNKYS